MYFANPWGLIGLLALPVIVGIHLFRRRFPVLHVAGAHLWGAETRVADAGRRRDRLPITASLLLELLAALLLTLALADPRMDETDAVVHLVAVLDDSASMQAIPPGKPFIRDQAVSELRRRAAQSGREARLTLVRTGIHPTLVGTRGMDWTAAAAALSSWAPSATQHGFQPAWDEALQLVGDDGRFLFLTDAPPPATAAPPQGMEMHAFGSPLPNLAFASARWTPGGAAEPGRVFLRVANYGREATDVRITGQSGGQPVFTQTLALPPQTELPVEVAAPAGLGQLDVSLASPTDPLAVDNRVTLIEPQPRIVRVAVDLPIDSPESQLVMKALDALPDWRLVETEQADLIVGDAALLPASGLSAWWFGIGPINRSEAFRKQSADLIGPYLIERQHPLLDGLSLGGVVWGGVQPNDLRLSPLISVDKSILLGRIEGTSTTAWLMNVDLARSNLGESPDWPILLANLVELRRDALPGLRRWNYRLGEAVQFRAPESPESAGELAVVTPSGRRRALVRDREEIVDLPALEEPGVYQVLSGNERFAQFAVNFIDVEESKLTGLQTDHREPPTRYEPSKISLDNPFSWLIVLAILSILAAVLVNWRLVDRGPRLRGATTGV